MSEIWLNLICNNKHPFRFAVLWIRIFAWIRSAVLWKRNRRKRNFLL